MRHKNLFMSRLSGDGLEPKSARVRGHLRNIPGFVPIAVLRTIL